MRRERRSPPPNDRSTTSRHSTKAAARQWARRASGPGRRAASPWHPSNWRLRAKVFVVLVVPACTALTFGGLRVQSEVVNAANYQRVVDRVDVERQMTQVVHELQRERVLVVSRSAAGSFQLDREPDITTQYDATDRAIRTLGADLAALNIPDPATRARYELGFDQLSGLRALRDLAGGAVYPDLAVLSAYSTMIDPLLRLDREVAPGDSGAASRASVVVLTIGQAKERAAQLDAVLVIAAQHNGFGAAIVQNKARSAQAGFDAAIQDFAGVATPEELQSYSDGYSGADVDQRRGIAQTSLDIPDPRAPLDVSVGELMSTGASANDKLRSVELGLITELRGQAASAAEAAATAAWRDGAIVVALLLVALALMLTVVALALVRPLRTLRREALEVARSRLPATVRRILEDPDPLQAAETAVEPLPLHSREEIGEVARSFDAVHEQAVRMAAQHAVLRDSVNTIFVNLSRRSQALIERQLAEIDQLERDEQDPEQLSRFFTLDHLAARMRRNSESLLILSGSGLIKRMGRPVSVGEVVASALSEVEHYTRVRTNALHEHRVEGRAVKDLVHLIAELLDNATTFSPPDTTVVVSSGWTRTGHLAIQVADEGIGMTEDELEKANEQLRDPPDFDAELSRRMGLHVVARLAKRHSILVRLHGDLIAGTTAVITLPTALVAEPDPITSPNGLARRTGPGTMPPRTSANPRSGWFQRSAPATNGASPAGGPATGGDAASGPRGASWPSAVDDDWQAVRSRLAGDAHPQADGGALPKRAPSERLVPGSAAGPAEHGQPAQPGRAGRSPDLLRSRLASYQQGLRNARLAEFGDGHPRPAVPTAPTDGLHN